MRRPFWLHQAAEYVVGLMLVLQGLRALDPVVPAVGGVLVLVNAAIAKGPLSAFGLVGRSLHRRLDLVVIVVLLAGAAQPWISVENVSRVLLLIVAVALGVIWINTDFTVRESTRRRGPGDADSGPSVARPAGRSVGGSFGGLAGRSIGRSVGRFAGRFAGRSAGHGAISGDPRYHSRAKTGEPGSDSPGSDSPVGTVGDAPEVASRPPISGEELGRRAGRSAGLVVQRFRARKR